jgi:hypothetical protein
MTDYADGISVVSPEATVDRASSDWLLSKKQMQLFGKDLTL